MYCLHRNGFCFLQLICACCEHAFDTYEALSFPKFHRKPHTLQCSWQMWLHIRAADCGGVIEELESIMQPCQSLHVMTGGQ